MDKTILIVGCGVSGLTSGIRLLEKRYSVKIITEKLPPAITSNIAAAYWYPYKVAPENKVREWASFSYQKFGELSNFKDTGVSFTELVKLFDHTEKEPFWKSAVRSFRRGSKEDLFNDYVDAYISEVPLIETPIYMEYLQNRFKELGGTIQKLQQKISSFNDLNSSADIIVNCTGLGSRELCMDEDSYPIRGQLVRTTNPGLRSIVSDEEGPLGLCYIVPRSNDCILGGTAEEDDWDTEVNMETAKEILWKCRQLEPRLKEARVLEHKVGLRPGRKEVRLEKEEISTELTVIHNYGHGGAGFTLSWGCAEDVLKILRTITN